MPSWRTILEVASWLKQLARELAIKEGFEPAEFDQLDTQLEFERIASIGSVLQWLQALLGKA